MIYRLENELMNICFYLLKCFLVLHCCCKVRDITSNPEWEKAYQYEIPVLAKIRPDGTEVLVFSLFSNLDF